MSTPPHAPDREIARATLDSMAEARAMAAAAGLEPEALKIDPADEARIRAVAEGSPADELFFKAKLKVDAAMRRVLFTETTGEPPGAWRGRGKGPS